MGVIIVSVSAKIINFDVPFMLGFFKVDEKADLRKFASVKCYEFGIKHKEEYNEDWLSLLSEATVYSEQNKELFNIKLKNND